MIKQRNFLFHGDVYRLVSTSSIYFDYLAKKVEVRENNGYGWKATEEEIKNFKEKYGVNIDDESLYYYFDADFFDNLQYINSDMEIE